MKDWDTGFKAITKKELQAALDQLPDDTWYSCQTMANTGNLVVYKGEWPNEEWYGFIDFVDGQLELKHHD